MATKNANLPQEVQQTLSIIPELSGSYQYYDKDGEIIYVGKAKNLKKRVYSYFNKHHDSPKLRVMVPQIAKIQFIVTDSEVEALILESHLIKKHKPKYNVLLKDDKKFPYFVITEEEYPRIIVARKANKNKIKGKYFGPYTDSRAMYATLDLIKKLFPLKQCKNPKFKDRPCLYYHIGRCMAPCQRLITPDEYKKILKNVELFLTGKQKELVDALKKEMEKYAAKEDFEKEITNLNNKKIRIRKAYIDELFTEEEYKEETTIVENKIKDLQKKILENEQVSKLNLSVDDILIKRDMDFINSIKLPILYNAFVDSWDGLGREEKAEIVMRYIDDIELELVNNKCKVKLTNFRSTFYKDFKSLFDKGYIDWKRKIVHSFNGFCVGGKVRYSEYLPAKEVYRHLMRLNECYEVNFYKGYLQKKTEELKMLPLHKGDVVVRIFPTEKDDDSKEILGMGMFVTKDSPNDIKVDIPDLFKCIPDIED